MQFKVKSTDLAARLNAISKVILGKNAIAVLDCFLFDITDDKLAVTGSDQENVVKTILIVNDVQGAGKIAIPAKLLLNFLSQLQEQTLTFFINEENKHITINYANGHFDLMGYDGDTYPQQKAMAEGSAEYAIKVGTVRAGLDNTLFAVATDTIRPVMTGVCWDIAPEDENGDPTTGITFVSTDTHILSRYNDRQSPLTERRTFIMPAKPATLLRAYIDKLDDKSDIIMTVDDKSARFNVGVLTLICRFINGKFPPYDRVIPRNNPFELIVNRTSLLGAARRVSLTQNDSEKEGLIKLTLHQNELTLTATDIQFNRNAEERLTCNYDGTDMAIGFNGNFFKEVLSHLICDEIVVKLADPARPVTFSPVQQEPEEDLVVLLMPMQIPD